MQKCDIRKEVRLLLRQLSPAEIAAKSEAVWRQVEALEEFRRAKTVLLYASLPDEVQTPDFIRRHRERLRLLLPVVHGDALLVGEATGLRRSERFGILEPELPLSEIPPVDVAIIPGVAFDRLNNRLGRGKGYYDKLLAACCTCKIGVCFRCQLLEHIPHDAHDVKMDRVVWETRES
jgi:5-formyltetrahydrofolate cyclo-ligase